MSDTLRARIERALRNNPGFLIGPVLDEADADHVYRMMTDAILAALPEADGFEIGELVFDASNRNPFPEAEDIAVCLRERYYIIPKGTDDE